MGSSGNDPTEAEGMSVATAVQAGEVLAPGERTLKELSEAFRFERDEAERHLVAALDHVIQAGRVLLEARQRVEPGGWGRWLDEMVEASAYTASAYMRCAEFEDELRLGLSTGAGLKEAIRFLRASGLDRTGHIGPPRGERRERGLRMLAQGATYREVAALCGVSKSTVQTWARPDLARGYQQRKAAREKARKEAERAKALKHAVRRAGGARAEAYAMAERLQDVLAKAHMEAEGREAKAAWSEAGVNYRAMRDHIVRAFGVS